MSAETDLDNASSSDQTPGDPLSAEPQTEPVLGKKAIFACALLLVMPAAIPFFFVTQRDAKNSGMLIGLGVIVLALNTLLLIVLVRWFRQLQQS